VVEDSLPNYPSGMSAELPGGCVPKDGQEDV
jgi:hypothetical protein